MIARPPEGSPDRNARLDPTRSYAPRQGNERFEANLAAIRLMRQLETEGRNATPAEKETLLAYTGWGWMKEAFNKVRAEQYEAQEQKLRSEWEAERAAYERIKDQYSWAKDPGTFDQYAQADAITITGAGGRSGGARRSSRWAGSPGACG